MFSPLQALEAASPDGSNWPVIDSRIVFVQIAGPGPLEDNGGGVGAAAGGGAPVLLLVMLPPPPFLLAHAYGADHMSGRQLVSTSFVVRHRLCVPFALSLHLYKHANKYTEDLAYSVMR